MLSPESTLVLSMFAGIKAYWRDEIFLASVFGLRWLDLASGSVSTGQFLENIHPDARMMQCDLAHQDKWQSLR